METTLHGVSPPEGVRMRDNNAYGAIQVGPYVSSSDHVTSALGLEGDLR